LFVKRTNYFTISYPRKRPRGDFSAFSGRIEICGPAKSGNPGLNPASMGSYACGRDLMTAGFKIIQSSRAGNLPRYGWSARSGPRRWGGTAKKKKPGIELAPPGTTGHWAGPAALVSKLPDALNLALTPQTGTSRAIGAVVRNWSDCWWPYGRAGRSPASGAATRVHLQKGARNRGGRAVPIRKAPFHGHFS